jgi:hypothetical protein
MHPRAVAVVFAAAAWFAGEGAARAQACCTSTSTIFPARLQDDEAALVGIRANGAVAYGSFDSQRVLHGQPSGASEIDLGQTLLVTARAANEPLQFNVSVPFVETIRSAGNVNDAGGGLGDVSFSMRWDITHAGKDPVVPGIAPLLSVTVPSGTAADSARNPLGADATGLGAAQLGAGLALEQIFGRTLFAIAGTATFHGSRTLAGIHSQLGPDIAAILGVSYTFRNGFALGGSIMYSNSFDSTINDQDVPNTARALTEVSITGAFPLKNDMRVLGSVFFIPPISSMGQNEIANAGLAITFIYGFPGGTCGGCAHGMCPPKK